MLEVWKKAKTEKGNFQVSNMGSIREVIPEGYKMRLDYKSAKRGYLTISLAGTPYRVHRLVAQAFLENPLNKPEVNHKNNTKNDNRVENLEWVTSQENRFHCQQWREENSHLMNYNRPNFQVEDIIAIFEQYESGQPISEICKLFGVSDSLISWVLEGYPDEDPEETLFRLMSPFLRQGQAICQTEIDLLSEQKIQDINFQSFFSNEDTVLYYRNLTNEYSLREIMQEVSVLCLNTVHKSTIKELDRIPAGISDELMEYSLKGLTSIKIF